ncbi:MAG: hypothetical protein KKB38_20705 [Gammaproteobacteria bacterium]|nr:hypothetical protein [Gammaproteobacteria bacterium]
MGINFTDISATAAMIAATWNNPLDELDQEIEDMKDGTATLSAPAITSFASAAHDHADAAGGGQLDWDDIWSDAVHDHSSAAEGGENLGQGGPVFINETANAQMTLGLTINQDANDNEILAVKSSDVAHGMTSVTETDTYGFLAKGHATGGGLAITGLTDTEVTNAQALVLAGFLGEAAATGKTSANYGIIRLKTGIKSGTSAGAVGADGDLVTIDNAGTTVFIFDTEGSAHAEIEWVAFDDFDDIALLSDLEAAVTHPDPITAEFGEFLKYSPQELTAAKIAYFDPARPGRAMVNFTRLAMLHTGAIRQLAARARRAEHALLSLGANPELLEVT